MLKDTIYMIIKTDGQIFKVTRNDIYHNHYQYLQDLVTENPELLPYSFGLTFKKDDATANIMFFQQLVLDGAIVFENHKILSSENVSSVGFYLPDKVSMEEKDIVNDLMEEINQIKYVFLEGYRDETEQFYALNQKREDILNGSNILREYMVNHFKIKEKR